MTQTIGLFVVMWGLAQAEGGPGIYRTGDSASWETLEYVPFQPYSHPRSALWHSLLHIPAMDGADVLPPGRWAYRSLLAVRSSDFRETAEGGESIFDAILHEEVFQVDHGVADQVEVGVRLSMGELLARDDDILLFEGGRQIVPDGERAFGLDSLVLRAKWGAPLMDGVMGALRMEVKAPLGREDRLLTAQTWDVSGMGALSWRAGNWTVHFDLGMMAPIGDPDLFLEEDDVDPVVAYGVSAMYGLQEGLTLGVQLEGNTSAFGGISVLDGSVGTVLVTGRYQLGRVSFLSAAVGTGLEERSGDWIVSVSLELWD
ncbi:MAG: hypothetical protein HYY16_14060 [Planctomycetes bacterium]|nr:hypothetical protein [Planctomycetota bacterium]